MADLTPDTSAGADTNALAANRPHLVAEASGLRVCSIGKRYKRRPVLRDVSLSVRRGEAVGLLGPNGAGKTTCFYCVTGLISPDVGTIELDGKDVTALPMYRRARLGIGYLPQEASIFRGMTVEGNLMAVLEVAEPKAHRRQAMLEDLLAEFSISHLRRAPALSLSGGERRRVEIARALASNPHFILLDEPLAGIDPIAVAEIRDLVAHLKDRGLGVLITDHNVRETLDIIDRAYILHDGTVMMEGAPSEIVAHEGVRRVYLGDSFSL
jgi:lipopolysaccharide export system ATP-binding protein